MSSKVKITIYSLIISCIILLVFITLGVSKQVSAQPDYIDLTKMNTNLVYSYVTNMVNSPNEYEGKTVKITGKYSYNENLQNHTITVLDTLGCCSQSIEFELQDKNYPTDNKSINIEGIFSTYKVNNQTLAKIVDATLT